MKLYPSRYFGRATGRHRPVLLPDKPVPAPDGPVRREVLDEESLAEQLLSPWPKPVRPLGAVAVQRFGDCPNCGKATAGITTRDGWLCGECFTPVTAGGPS